MLHVDLPTRADIETLAAHRGAPAVSIYLRTTPLTQDAGAGRIELKNLLKDAIARIEAADAAKRDVWPIETAVEALIEDEDFWATQANSLAIFATPERTRTFRLPNRLQNIVAASDRFHIKPLLRAVTFPHNAFVLAISVGAVRLVEVTADLAPHEVRVAGLPKDFNDALGKRSHVEKSGAVRSGMQASEHAMFSRFARAVDAALRPVLAGHERPLIVAAAEPLASIYRSVSTYPHTAEAVIAGSADRTPDHELAGEARAILDAIYAERLRALGDLFALRENQGRAVTDVAQAARAATFGAVDTLIVDMDEVVHGTVDDADGAVRFAEGPSAGSYGVVDEIASRALRSGATLLAARRSDIPGQNGLAAILRYPI